MSKENVETQEQTEEQTEQQETTYSQSDVDSQVSKAVDKALKKQKAQLEKQKQREIEEAKKESERKAKLSEQERKNEEMTDREKDLEERAAEIERKELKAEALSALSSKGFPAENQDFFADKLLGKDVEKTKENIEEFVNYHKQVVQEEVKASYRQSSPKVSDAGVQPKTTSKKEMAKKARII